MNPYVLTEDAKRDLDDITEWMLKKGGPPLVRHVLEPLRTAMERLGETPGPGHRRDDLTDAPVRVWQEFSWLIVYDPEPRPVHVLRVLHSSRDVARILGRGSA